MNCPHCQTALADNARFCSACGTALAVTRPAEGERKLVTVLFADVIGSTSLGERLDPEQVTEIMNGAFEQFNAAVIRYGGTVARLLGDAVLAIFGAPVAHEDDPERAVLAGLAIQEAAKRYEQPVAERYGIDFGVRVGINTGLAVLTTVGDESRTEYTAMGDTVNVAARMQSAAAPGTVLVSAETYHFVNRIFDIITRGPVEVKGKSAPMEVYEISGVKDLPGKTRGLEGIASILVGRDRELSTLRGSLEAARAGRGSFVTIGGEAGLGKSRLISELHTVAREADSRVQWLEGRAISYGQSLAYYPWRTLLRGAIGVHDAAPPETTRTALQRTWQAHQLSDGALVFMEALLGIESATSEAVAADLQRIEITQGITDAMRAYIAALASETALVLVFDDLHWADDASLDLLVEVAALVARAPIVMVGVMRPDRHAASWDVLQHIEGQLGDRATRLDLEPLSASSSQTLLGNLLYIEELPEPVRMLMLRKSEGNPFFLEEVIRSLIDSAYLVHEDGHWRATREIRDVAIPDTLQGLLTERIDRLPAPTKQVAQLAAVIGRTFPYDVLAGVLDRGPAEQRIAEPRAHLEKLSLEELIREWRSDPRLEYIFKHALTQEAAYDLLLMRRRREFHCRVGLVLEELYPERLDELAPLIERHFWLGEDWPRALHYARRAGAEAERAGARREASDHYDRAYHALKRMEEPDGGELVDVILSWARASYKIVPSDAVFERLAEGEAAARALDDKRRLAQTLNWIGNIHFYLGVPSAGVAALAEGDRLARESGDETLVLAWTFLMTESLVDRSPRAALVQIDRVIDLARKNHYEDIEAHAIGVKAVAHARLGEFAPAVKALIYALDLVRRLDSPVKEADILSAGAHVYFDMGDTERGLESSRYGAELAYSVNGYECGAYSMFSTGMGYLQKGAWAEAESILTESARRADASKIFSEWLRNRIRAAIAMSRLPASDPAAIGELEASLDRAHDFEDEYLVAQLEHALGDGARERGNLVQARCYLEAALDYYRRNGMQPYLPGVLASLATLEEQAGNLEPAAALRREADQIAGDLRLESALAKRSLAAAGSMAAARPG